MENHFCLLIFILHEPFRLQNAAHFKAVLVIINSIHIIKQLNVKS